MPRLRKTEAQRRAERFAEQYRVGKARKGYTDEQIASVLGIGRSALFAKRKTPEKLSLGELSKLSAILDWSDEVCMEIIRP